MQKYEFGKIWGSEKKTFVLFNVGYGRQSITISTRSTDDLRAKCAAIYKSK